MLIEELKDFIKNFHYDWVIEKKLIRTPMIVYSKDKSMAAIICKN